MYGVMSERKKARNESWPLKKTRPSERDRNSWVSFYLRRYIVLKRKKDDGPDK